MQRLVEQRILAFEQLFWDELADFQAKCQKPAGRKIVRRILPALDFTETGGKALTRVSYTCILPA